MVSGSPSYGGDFRSTHPFKAPENRRTLGSTSFVQILPQHGAVGNRMNHGHYPISSKPLLRRGSLRLASFRGHVDQNENYDAVRKVKFDVVVWKFV